ncbi:hypothetical protein BJY59DRAFT_703288 [Rhodotorula toruloides]
MLVLAGVELESVRSVADAVDGRGGEDRSEEKQSGKHRDSASSVESVVGGREGEARSGIAGRTADSAGQAAPPTAHRSA